MCELAKAKSYLHNMETDRDVQTLVSRAAKNAICSSQVQQLSIPKKSNLKSEYFMDNREPEEPITKISKAAKKCVASPRQDFKI